MKRTFLLSLALVFLISCSDKTVKVKGRTTDSSVWVTAFNINSHLPVSVPVVKIILDTLVWQPDPKDSTKNIRKRLTDSVYIFIQKGDTVRGINKKPIIDSVTRKPKINKDTYIQIAPANAVEITKIIPKQ